MQDERMLVDTKMSRHVAGSPRTLPALALASLVIQGLVVRPALAQEDNSADTAAARTFAVDGLRLADAGKCGEAIDKLARAEKLHHAPIVLSRLGECQVTQGKIVDGTENLRKVLREPLPSNPPPALIKARERAQTVLDSAKPKIAMLTISVKGAKESNATVTVDGQAMQTVLLDSERPTDPGEHVVEATAPGFLKASSRVTVGAGDKQAVTLELQADPNAVAPSPPPASTSTLAPSHGTSGRAGESVSLTPGPPSRSAAYVAWAVGASALVVGGGFGVIALKDKGDLADKCKPADNCPPSAQSTIDNGKLAGNVATIGFIVGGVGIALGTVFYFTASPRATSTGLASSQHSAAAPKPELGAWVGVGQAGLAGRF
jgi:hypothetical protein